MKKYLDEIKAKWFMPVPTGYSEGAVDFLICYAGHYIALETKVHPRVVTEKQFEFLADVVKSGGSAFVAYELNEVKIGITRIDSGEVYVHPLVEKWMEDERIQRGAISV